MKSLFMPQTKIYVMTKAMNCKPKKKSKNVRNSYPTRRNLSSYLMTYIVSRRFDSFSSPF